MNQIELLQNLHSLNENELFYKRYQDEKKHPDTFPAYLASLDMNEILEHHYVIPEIMETMPPSMKDEYFYSDSELGILLQKHNCYSPEFTHFHTYFEALYVFEGICRHTADGKTRILRMGDLCIIPPGVSHAVDVQDSSIVINVILSTEVIENVFKNPAYYKQNLLSEFFLKNLRGSSDHTFLSVHTGNDQELKDLIIQMMLESINKYQEYDVILYSLFAVFFAKLLRFYENTIEISSSRFSDSRKAYDISAYIEEHHNSVTLNSLAAHFGYTPEYTSRLIRKITGSSFMELLSESRMKHAIALLKSTSLPVSNVANAVGYESTENFIRVFKKRYSMTPSAYRRTANKNMIL